MGLSLRPYGGLSNAITLQPCCPPCSDNGCSTSRLHQDKQKFIVHCAILSLLEHLHLYWAVQKAATVQPCSLSGSDDGCSTSRMLAGRGSQGSLNCTQTLQTKIGLIAHNDCAAFLPSCCDNGCTTRLQEEYSRSSLCTLACSLMTQTVLASMNSNQSAALLPTLL